MFNFFFSLLSKSSKIAAVEQTLEEGLAEAQGSPGNYGWLFTKMLLSLALLILLMCLTAWLLRRFIRHRLQKGANAALIQIVEKRVLSPKTMLYVVEMEGQKVLFAESHLEIKALHVMENPKTNTEV